MIRAVRVAWISQDFFDPSFDERGDPPAICAEMGSLPPFATAHAHIDGDGEEAADFPTVDEAIEWARRRAGRVLVRVGHSRYYAAGKDPSPGYPPWPPTEEAIRSEAIRDG